jgi:hypothetical protein
MLIIPTTSTIITNQSGSKKVEIIEKNYGYSTFFAKYIEVEKDGSEKVSYANSFNTLIGAKKWANTILGI